MNLKDSEKQQILKVMEYSDLILEVVDNQDEYTRSDLQGRVEAIVMQIIRETKNKKEVNI